MIFGIGTDIAAVVRLQRLYERHGEAALNHLLAPCERADFERAVDKGRFLAKRFAAKEAFAKALGTGLRAPALLPNIAVSHDSLGKPRLEFAPELMIIMQERGLIPHLSISDEKEFVVAFVVLECA
ncbi:MAG: Holo-acyl carrier protein synthase:phosphopantetheine-protein transferase [Proteobacteria bacterium]|nr:Holo-acyl carrier protein synthase:phosphopantetheine-protein transferase [Pseudomonadota bacterium]